MRNPCLKKNPFMSMWLSGANAAAGKTRMAGTAEVRRQQAAAVKLTTAMLMSAWGLPTKPTRRRIKRS